MTKKLIILLILQLIILACQEYYIYERPIKSEATKRRSEDIIKRVLDNNDRKMLLGIVKIYSGAFYNYTTDEKGQVIELHRNPCHQISEKEFRLLIKMKNLKIITCLYISNKEQLTLFNSKQYSLISYLLANDKGQLDLSIKDDGPFTNDLSRKFKK